MFECKYNIVEVLNLLNLNYVQKNNNLLVDCPNRKKIQFAVSLEKAKWHCYKSCPGCSSKGDAIDLYQSFMGLADMKSAMTELDKIFNSGVELKKPVKIKPYTKKVEVADIEVRNKIYQTFLNACNLCVGHEKDLLHRGLSKEAIIKFGYKSVPQLGKDSIVEALSKSYNLDGVPGFYEKNGNPKGAFFKSGYYIPVLDIDGKIQGMQVRFDIGIPKEATEEEKKELKRKRFRWFSSSFSDSGCSIPNFPHFANFNKGVDTTVYATEGCNKANVASFLSNKPFVAIQGCGCFNEWRALLKLLKENGVTKVIDAFDMDRFENKNVQENIEKLHQIATEEEMEMIYMKWDTKFKGIDDFLLHQKHNNTDTL